MSQRDQVTVELQTLMHDGRLSQQNFRRWARYRVPGNSPQWLPDSPHLSPELPSLTEPAHRIRYSRIANPSFE
jgi:hypothetical protein